jgi:hypothetical protein
MKSKTISNSKFKNSGVLFELLIRQITAETLSGKPTSPALSILKKYYNTETELGKELQLYRAFFDANSGAKPLSEAKALDFIDLVLSQRKKLDEKRLAREKYNLIKEIKEHYDLKEFLSHKIPNYTLHASIFKTFSNEAAKSQDIQILNVKDIATARYTLVEHLIRNNKKATEPSNSLFEEYKKESEELRLLAYKFAVDKFNEKYANLNDKQKKLLREFINNIPSTNSLFEYIRVEVPSLKKELLTSAKKTTDKVVAIKLNEVANQIDSIGRTKVVRDNEITALMIAYEILKEVS